MPEKCYFCGLGDVVEFNEHYIFCKDCTAIYTFSMILMKNCKHIKEGIPEVEREPWFQSCKKKKIYIRNDVDGKQRCSICGNSCIADGW